MNRPQFVSKRDMVPPRLESGRLVKMHIIVQGYASICGLITCDWIGAAEDEDLPKRVVLKVGILDQFKL